MNDHAFVTSLHLGRLIVRSWHIHKTQNGCGCYMHAHKRRMATVKSSCMISKRN